MFTLQEIEQTLKEVYKAIGKFDKEIFLLLLNDKKKILPQVDNNKTISYRRGI